MTTDVADGTVELHGRVGRLAEESRVVRDAANGFLPGCTRQPAEETPANWGWLAGEEYNL
jgi:hypothetical protein